MAYTVLISFFKYAYWAFSIQKWIKLKEVHFIMCAMHKNPQRIYSYRDSYSTKLWNSFSVRRLYSILKPPCLPQRLGSSCPSGQQRAVASHLRRAMWPQRAEAGCPHRRWWCYPPSERSGGWCCVQKWCSRCCSRNPWQIWWNGCEAERQSTQSAFVESLHRLLNRHSSWIMETFTFCFILA